MQSLVYVCNLLCCFDFNVIAAAKVTGKWGFHKDKYCPAEHKYDGIYSSIEDAKTACLADPNCGFVYDWQCDDSSSTYKIELCKQFSESDLYSHSPDCVYVKPNGE